MNNIIYNGPFKNHIQDFIELKQAMGYKFYSEAIQLKRFDTFIIEKYPAAILLTKEIMLDWCRKKTYEAQSNQCARVSIIRQSGKYLDSLGVMVYIIPKSYYPVGKKYMPHIYTTDELTKLFAATDKCKFYSNRPYRNLIMPVIFRMIYACGLRASEARLLKVADVDLENGILTIRHSKNNNSRFIPMSDSLTERCRHYSKIVHLFPVSKEYYFPALDGKPLTLDNLYHNFRRFLWNARISHGGRGSGPRIHDLRHTYAVHCLKKWTEQEKDLSVYLPILRIYLGHASFAGTAYYLRLTADVFPNITLKIEASYHDIIPELKGDANETY